jgi:hypothetical protein
MQKAKNKKVDEVLRRAYKRHAKDEHTRRAVERVLMRPKRKQTKDLPSV